MRRSSVVIGCGEIELAAAFYLPLAYSSIEITYKSNASIDIVDIHIKDIASHTKVRINNTHLAIKG